MDGFSVTEWRKSEILVVGVTLAIVFGLSFFQIKLGEMKTRDAQRKSDVEMVSRGLRAYFDQNKMYPEMATAEGKIKSCGGKADEVCEWFTGPMQDVDGMTYINKLPRDPWGDKGWTYWYEVNLERTHFRVYVGLENKMDPDYKKDLTIECGKRVQCSWYVEE